MVNTVKSTQKDQAIQQLFQQEREAEIKQRKSKRQRPPKEQDVNPGEPVSNQDVISKMRTEPSFGKLERSQSQDFEVITRNVAKPGQESPVSTESLQPLDAYWGSYGTPVARALARSSNPVMEVVIGPDDRIQITRTNEYPWRCICSLLITAADGTSWIGTGWLVAPRLLLTAGHCVYMHNQGGWASQIEVIPGRNGSDRPFGSCITSNLRSVVGWTNSRDRNYDYGAILLPENCRYGDQLGWFGYAVKNDGELNQLVTNLSGYPGDKPNGTQWFHSRTLKDVDSQVLTYETDTAGGQSGAPVWVRMQDGNRYGVGIHTNGDLAGNSATRINQEVYNNIVRWLAEVP
jgi:glutamyl endopeptidase